MGHSRKLVLLLGLTACAAVLLIGSAGAGKRPQLTTVSASGEVADGYTTLTSKCRGKSGTISTGFSTPFTDAAGGGGPNVLTTESRRDGNRRALATGIDLAASDQGRLTTRAYCLKPKLKIRTVQRDLDLGVDIGTVTAICPPGSAVVSGGFRAGTGEVLLTPFASKRSGKSKWTASAVNPVGGFASDVLSVYAYCAKNAPKIKTVSESATVQPKELTILQPRCKKRTTPISGGFESFAGDGRFAVTTISQRTKRGWKVSGYGSGGSPSTLRAFAYCAKL